MKYETDKSRLPLNNSPWNRDPGGRKPEEEITGCRMQSLKATGLELR
jgi:hypothetical protein